MKEMLLRGIKTYQSYSATRPCRCRYFPTCSHYTAEAIETYGAVKGSWMGLKRISRCRPFGAHGYDPVPAESECC